MKKLLLPLLALGLAFLTGCGTVAPKPQPAITAPLIMEELQPYLEHGDAEVSGQAFLKTRGGDVKLAAGNQVALLPDTPFMREGLTILQTTGAYPSNYTPEIRKQLEPAIRRVIADAEGRFSFAGVPPGNYILQVRIVWEVPGYYGLTQTGGLVLKPITVKPGDSQVVMLTR